MPDNKYTFKSLNDILIDDAKLAELFLEEKSETEVRAYDRAMAKLNIDERRKTADPIINRDKIFDIVSDTVDNNPNEYPNLYNLADVDFAYIIQEISRRYKAITRDPRLYKLNYTNFLKYYDALISENWNEFEKQRIQLQREFDAQGKERNRTTKCNVAIMDKLFNLIYSIDITKVHSL